jgi:hypothetical protein
MADAGIPDLTPRDAEAQDPRPLYSCHGEGGYSFHAVDFYTPSPERSPDPRIVAVWVKGVLGVWDVTSGRFLAALHARTGGRVTCLITYHMNTTKGPRIAAGMGTGEVCVWDGDDLGILFSIYSAAHRAAVHHLVAYLNPGEQGGSRLVSYDGDATLNVRLYPANSPTPSRSDTDSLRMNPPYPRYVLLSPSQRSNGLTHSERWLSFLFSSLYVRPRSWTARQGRSTGRFDHPDSLWAATCPETGRLLGFWPGGRGEGFVCLIPRRARNCLSSVPGRRSPAAFLPWHSWNRPPPCPILASSRVARRGLARWANRLGVD